MMRVDHMVISLMKEAEKNQEHWKKLLKGFYGE